MLAQLGMDVLGHPIHYKDLFDVTVFRLDEGIDTGDLLVRSPRGTNFASHFRWLRVPGGNGSWT